MKNKAKTLMAATIALSQIAVGSGAVWATEMPVGDLGPEVYIQKIIPDEQKIVMYYYDQGGRDREQWIENLNVVWPKEANGDDVAVELEDVEPSWANTFFNGDAQAILVSGWSGEVQKQAEAPDLQENIQNVLYFSVQLRSHNPALDRMYWSDKANYNDCMQYYQPGIVCEAKIEDDSTIKYEPYLDGVLLSGQSEVDTEPTVEPGEGADEDEPIVMTPENPEPVSVEPEMTTVKPVAPALIAGVGSAVVDSGSGGSKLTMPTTQTAELNDEIVVDELTEEPQTAESAVMSTEEESALEVPELGDAKDQNYWLLVLTALAVATGVLMAYWWIILPVVKRKKEDENTEK